MERHDGFIPFPSHMHVSECNELDRNSNSSISHSEPYCKTKSSKEQQGFVKIIKYFYAERFYIKSFKFCLR